MANFVSGLDVPIPSWLPNWLKSYLRYGVEAESERQNRRQATWNVICLVGSLNCFTYVVVIFIQSFELWPVAIVSVLFACLFFPQAFVYRQNPVISVCFSATINCVFWSIATFQLGIKSGIFLFILNTPAIGMIVLGLKHIRLVIALTILAIVSVIFCVLFVDEPFLSAARSGAFQAVLLTMSATLTATTIFSASYVAYLNAEIAEDALEAEYDRSEMLLRNILPDPIAIRLKENPDKVIADRYDEVAVLFADIVNFTPKAMRQPPEQVVQMLNRIFSEFDALVEKHGLEKIKTVGDAYMVVAGIPNYQENAVAIMADFALDMIAATRRLSKHLNDEIELRVGIHQGEAVAGVIGTKKLAYDIWGDTVNTAARMEAFGVPNRVQVTENVKAALEDRYVFDERGIVDVKGKGPMRLYFLQERAA